MNCRDARYLFSSRARVFRVLSPAGCVMNAILSHFPVNSSRRRSELANTMGREERLMGRRADGSSIKSDRAGALPTQFGVASREELTNARGVTSGRRG